MPTPRLRVAAVVTVRVRATTPRIWRQCLDSIITGCGLPLRWPRCARAALNIEQLVVPDMFEQHLSRLLAGSASDIGTKHTHRSIRRFLQVAHQTYLYYKTY